MTVAYPRYLPRGYAHLRYVRTEDLLAGAPADSGLCYVIVDAQWHKTLATTAPAEPLEVWRRLRAPNPLSSLDPCRKWLDRAFEIGAEVLRTVGLVWLGALVVVLSNAIRRGKRIAEARAASAVAVGVRSEP